MTTSSDRFHNRLYRATITRTSAGSPVLKLTPTNPKGRYAGHRQIAAMLYELAADMERRSDDLGERWVVTLDPTGGRIVVEVSSAQEAERAHEFLVQVVADYDLG